MSRAGFVAIPGDRSPRKIDDREIAFEAPFQPERGDLRYQIPVPESADSEKSQGIIELSIERSKVLVIVFSLGPCIPIEAHENIGRTADAVAVAIRRIEIPCFPFLPRDVSGSRGISFICMRCIKLHPRVIVD